MSSVGGGEAPRLTGNRRPLVVRSGLQLATAFGPKRALAARILTMRRLEKAVGRNRRLWARAWRLNYDAVVLPGGAWTRTRFAATQTRSLL